MRIKGYFKAYHEIEVADNATDEEIKKEMLEAMEWYYFTTLGLEDIVIEK